MTKPLLELRQLSCERDERPLFSDLNLSCGPGEAVQILGPNGSGKTTLLRTLAGLCREYRGQILWCGEPVSRVGWDYRHNILFIGHRPGIKTALTPRENLAWYSALTDHASRDAIDTALGRAGLPGYEDIPCAQLSAGQLRRVALARLHLSRARVWILDEPFTAIDKSGVAELEALMASHTSNGGLVMLSSHQELALPGLRRVDLMDYPAKWLEPEELHNA
ncbi:cytochrome c biogenesis heme-transporting ATPase CcmA [Marinimicrobium sp. ABcell2]|uniref:cytochrome c biogenesis heme-transporting ATPase CcmA n=1 Tax=Marinimicrobium sp. ABcell2 TaxID=3069751 RepID=UPI0027B3DA4D|nr:cytochrome c biogenesis heme-transporting ATPase CcmA [Marinimicrobium sp. ABcell2]MDQ2077849.1 cytochrome c biogenesis heme-transporting ATPase CcmA [Marinimicrobium sp. ABcell2]